MATRPGPDTEQLLEAVRCGDAPARGRLLERHRPKLRRMVGIRLDRRLAARVDPDLFVNTSDQGGVTLNDSQSHDGTNHFQNFPILTAAQYGSVTGTLSSIRNTTFRLEFFANHEADPSGYGEGEHYVGFVNVTTDATGNASFTAPLAALLPGEGFLSATATNLATGDTSEFSADIAVPATPPPSSVSGFVFEDLNNDGQVDFGEKGIAGVTVTLTGADDFGNAVSLPQVTDADGAYLFLNLRPGNYYITETQPVGYLQGIDSVGTAGGSLSATDQFLIPLGPGVNGLNYNFGEQPTATGPVHHGQTAGIGFWNNKNGQALIKSLNNGVGSELADWLAATLPNMFGIRAGSNNLSGKNNSAVAALFQQDFLLKGVKLDAQVLATALSVYATNAALDSTGGPPTTASRSVATGLARLRSTLAATAPPSAWPTTRC